MTEAADATMLSERTARSLMINLLLVLTFQTQGTRIIYDRKFLLNCRSSPVAKTPPRGLPNIPGVTSPPSKDTTEKAHNGEPLNNNSISAPDSNNTGTSILQIHRWVAFEMKDSVVDS